MYIPSVIQKELVAAPSEALILSLLAKGESYGYALVQDIKARSESQAQWPDGMLYPLLHRMEKNGWIKSRWVTGGNGRRRKCYSLRRDGKQSLERRHDRWTKVPAVLAQSWREQYV